MDSFASNMDAGRPTDTFISETIDSGVERMRSEREHTHSMCSHNTSSACAAYVHMKC